MPDRRRVIPVLVLLSLTGAGCTSAAPVPAGGPASSPASAPRPGPAVSVADVARAAPGWPAPKAAYLGRYKLTGSSDPSFARAGLLTLFMRTITKPKKMVVPSGILSVYGPGTTSVLYLSQFGHLGQRGVADVTAGLYAAPPAGTVALTAFTADSHTLTLVLSPSGGAPVTMRFTRYSADPHP